MRSHITLAVAAAIAFAVVGRAADSFDDAMKRASVDYTARAKVAAEELNNVRKRIADEKAPLLQDLRSAEDKIVSLQSELERIGTSADDASNRRRKLISDLDAIRRSSGYVDTLAHDGIASFGENLEPGESQRVSDRIQALEDKLDDTSNGPSAVTAVEIAGFLADRIELQLGGYSAEGSALVNGSNDVVKGAFAYVGPETFFSPGNGSGAGTVRPRTGSLYPVDYPIPLWSPTDSAAFFTGKPSVILADASGGKALRLRETKGTIIEHIQKGGLVAYFIIGVGFLALIMIAQKIFDLSRLGLDSPQTIHSVLALVATGENAKAEVAIKALKPPARELLAAGLKFSGRSRELLEEHLESVLLRQRLHFERRLPLLAVIATASPLMGLLGTVVGMVKTFALITVFGTGNAGKLASGISEVLVATELGLVVAIPTLIAHGFLAHRIQRNLSLLEKYALEFVTAATVAKESGRTVAI